MKWIRIKNVKLCKIQIKKWHLNRRRNKKDFIRYHCRRCKELRLKGFKSNQNCFYEPSDSPRIRFQCYMFRNSGRFVLQFNDEVWFKCGARKRSRLKLRFLGNNKKWIAKRTNYWHLICICVCTVQNPRLIVKYEIFHSTLKNKNRRLSHLVKLSQTKKN